MFIVSAAFFKGNDVVNFFCRGQALLLQTFLAERVGIDVSVSYPSPRSTVTFRGIIGTLVLVVPGVHHLGVFLTVTVVGELGTAGVTARLLGFGRHGATSVRVYKKPVWFPTQASYYSFAL